MIPQGGEIVPQLMKLKEAADKKGPEAEKLAKDTVEEIKQVLEKKKDEVEKLLKSV